jgi:hypothetical protein
MRFSIIIASAALLGATIVAGPAAARLVSPGLGISWGKPGVSLAQYRADAIQCGYRAAGTDLAGTDPANALVLGSRRMENDPGVNPSAVVDPTAGPSAAADAAQSAGSTPSVMRLVRPEQQFAKAGDILEAALESCLREHGYHKFKLTSEQRHRLSKLPPGSDARHAYLHSLASNPDVLTHQAAALTSRKAIRPNRSCWHRA